jgi:hypothetical protein
MSKQTKEYSTMENNGKNEMVTGNETMLVCFVNTTQKALKVEHISYFGFNDEGGRTSTLVAVVRETYPHPTAPDDAVVTVMTTRQICTCKTGTPEHASIQLLIYAQENIKNVEAFSMAQKAVFDAVMRDWVFN